MEDEIVTLGREYFSDISNPEQRQQVVEDLLGVGITKQFFPNVHFAKNSDDLSKWVTNRFRIGQPVMIFGTFGTGKTQVIHQAARKLGYDVITESTATKLPEDFGGIPMPLTVKKDQVQQRAAVASAIRSEKLSAAVDAEMEKSGKNYMSPKIARQTIAKRLAPTIQVDDAEIDARMGEFSDERIEQRVSAPDWVFKVIDNYVIHGKRTVLFFDEINQGQSGTLNTLFDLVQHKRFGNRDEYSFKDAVIFAAAGNFPRDNPSVQPISLPLLDRFKYIIYYGGDWGRSIEYVKNSYLEMSDDYPHLAEMLADSSVSLDAWARTFQSPRAIEDFIEGLAELEEISKTKGPDALSDIDDLDSVGLSGRNVTTLATAVMRFLADIGVPYYANKRKQDMAGSSTFNTTKKTINLMQKLWVTLNVRGEAQLSSSIGRVDLSPAGLKKLFDYVKQALGDAYQPEILTSMVTDKGKTFYDALKEAGIDV
ncbi:MAG: hypothetical protein NC218_01340 [Acetobacter sp.]|nr:hypothetical protein [Acetobacter sp.]